MAEDKLPENWRETIAGCDFALANEVLRDVFLFNERKAASEGKQAAYPSEYLQGWEAFAMQPSYQTAVRFIEGAREGGPALYALFLSWSPGSEPYENHALLKRLKSKRE